MNQTIAEMEVGLGEKIKLLRLNKNLDQKTLAARAGVKDVERLIGEIDALMRLKGHCAHGRVDFDSCSYVQGRRSTVSMAGRMDAKDAQVSLPLRLAIFNQATVEENAAKTRLDTQATRVNELRANVTRLRMRVTL